MTTTSDLAAILLACEEEGGGAARYRSEDPGDSKDITESIGFTLPYASEGGSVFAVSDLHLASGKGPDGRYDGCENFYFDESFRRFIRHVSGRSPDDAEVRPNPKGISHTFILNGDTIDFLRVTYVPGRTGRPTRPHRLLTYMKIGQRKNRTAESKAPFAKDFEEWREILLRVGIDKTAEELDKSVSDKEEVYGLETQDFKSVLRLATVIRGHTQFFEALADWLAAGNRLLVVKGNHDLEWYWLAVRNYLRLDLAERLGTKKGGGSDRTRDALVNTVLEKVIFADHAVLIDGDFYLEHGHPYDPVTRVFGENRVNVPKDSKADPEAGELNIPFGSFFNRYVINLLELAYPNLDKIRPTPNVLLLMLRQNAFAGLRMLAAHLVFAWKTLRRGYVNYIFGQHLLRQLAYIGAVILGLPAALYFYQCWAKPGKLIGGIEWILIVIAIHAAIQAVAQWQLTEPDSLARFARLRFDENPKYRLITFGHTHNPDQFEKNGRWFYNTGTWIPVIETSATSLREDRQFAFLRLDHNGHQLEPGLMQQWDDDALRGQPMTLVRREVKWSRWRQWQINRKARAAGRQPSQSQ